MCRGKRATLVGSTDDDFITGTKGRDVIVSYSGNDRIEARFGRDLICAGKGEDLARGGLGNDYVLGGSGSDRLIGGSENDDLNGGQGSDLLRGSLGRDVLIDGSGNDQNGGGSGNDTVSYQKSPMPIHADLGLGIIQGWGSDRITTVERLVGSSFNDLLIGAAGSQALDGAPGDDMIDGLQGKDRLMGGNGADSLNGGEGFDEVSYSGSERGIEASLETKAATGQGKDVFNSIEGLRGSRVFDHFVGDGRVNLLIGGLGNDRLLGGPGGDILEGGLGNDFISGQRGTDTASFAHAPRYVSADLTNGQSLGEGADQILGIEDLLGSTNNDELVGDIHRNELLGGIGRDHLLGRQEQDYLDGGPNHDRLRGGAAKDSCVNRDLYDTRDDMLRQCELLNHADGGSTSLIKRPGYGDRISSRELKSLAGRFVDPPLFDVTSVKLALRRSSSGGCFWWTGKGLNFRRRPCNRPIWFNAHLDREQDRWTYLLEGRFVAGSYDVRSVAKDQNRSYTEPCCFRKLNRVHFQIS